MARFNLHPNVAVQININNGIRMSQEEILTLYSKLLNESTIIYDVKNHKRRIIIIELQEQCFHISVVGNKTFNDILFTKIDKNDIKEIVKDTKKIMLKESGIRNAKFKN